MENSENRNHEAQHLCVLMHGLWGNPDHLKVMATSLREKYPDENLHILVAKSNCGSLTYDGIELGGERLCQEIEDEVENLARRAQRIRRFSIAGYSIGGLVARYAVGLLDSQGFFDDITPVNFTAFASPFLGARSPMRGWHSDIMNVLGAHAFCMSGRELFMIDKFRGTGRPLLEILADQESIFIKGLAKFERRTLYGNIVNDPSAVYYTTTISKTDPYTNLDNINPSYLEGYEDVIVNIRGPITPKDPEDSELSLHSRLIKHTPTTVGRLLFRLGMAIFIPIFGTIVFITSIVQSIRSPRRIYLHEKGLAGTHAEDYNVPLITTSMEGDSVPQAINNMQEAAEDVYQNFSSAQSNEYLLSAEEKPFQDDSSTPQSERQQLSKVRKDYAVSEKPGVWQPDDVPTLALAPNQFSMISTLDKLGWRKYPVYIHKVRRAHAALVVRIDSPSFDEGRVVLRHWLDEEFIL